MAEEKIIERTTVTEKIVAAPKSKEIKIKDTSPKNEIKIKVVKEPKQPKEPKSKPAKEPKPKAVPKKKTTTTKTIKYFQ